MRIKITFYKLLLNLLLLMIAVNSSALNSDSLPARTLTMQEYEKAKTFTVKDMDKDTYVKFENTYVLDRYERKKPYFITGDDSLKKRIDIYKLLAKDGMQELGVMIFYTNEKGKIYKAVLPAIAANSKVWQRYFEDIHAIEGEEKNFILKLSYVLSKELSFQLYKAQGKDTDKEEGTYGMDICFPGENEVEMADGTTKALQDIQPGDFVLTVDPVTTQNKITKVQSLTVHAASNYAITELLLISASEKNNLTNIEVLLLSKILKATPNHPIKTSDGIKPAGLVVPGQKVLCLNEIGGNYNMYTVWNTSEYAAGVQKVYNMVAESGETFIMNSVMVMQKQALQ